MSGRDQEQQTIRRYSFAMKGKLVFGVVAVLSVAAVVCFVALSAKSSPNKTEVESPANNMKRSIVESAVSHEEKEESHLSTNFETENKRRKRSATHVSRQAQRLARGVPNPQPRVDMTCKSYPSNKTIPAAHVKGHSKWTGATAVHPEPQGYQQRWRCMEFQGSHQAAYVDGGMIFNQTDKSLYVPTCGYYHIFSQVLFEPEVATSDDDRTSVFHMLKYQRNCNWPERQPNLVLGKSSFYPRQPNTVTTYTGDVVKLCAGGRIWVEIPNDPNGVPCCPKGDEQGTFLGAVLIAETTCLWPPSRIEMDNPNA